MLYENWDVRVQATLQSPGSPGQSNRDGKSTGMICHSPAKAGIR